jgi:hypothetical protein
MPCKLTFNEFKKRSHKKYRSKYNYSEAEPFFENASSKIPIICPIHGKFFQEARKHYEGNECIKCGYIRVSKSLASNKKEFILRAKKIHGNKYNYKLIKYKNKKTSICIVCSKHGKFWQIPETHLRGCGCKKCSGYFKNSTEDFIKKAIKIHKNKYDYSLVDYKTAHTKVIIICPQHGQFLQKPNAHINGSGCPGCKLERIINNNPRKKTQKEFIDQITNIHGKKYDYSKTIYKGDSKYVTITCPKHGEFKQIANYHLHGNGCPKCNNSTGELNIEKFLKTNKIPFIHQKRFNDCKDSLCLPFDFYLPGYNLCIEFDGIQHFRPVKIFGGKERFLILKKHDLIKSNYCKNKNINLIRISYKDKIENKLYFMFVLITGIL